MKYLKSFNENFKEVFKDPSFNPLSTKIKTFEISPKTDMLNIKSVFDILIVELSQPIIVESDWGAPNEEVFCILIDLMQDYPYISLHNSLDDAVEWGIPEDYNSGYLITTFSQLRNYYQKSFVNVIEYNDVNFQEIENMLMDFDNINIKNIWGILS